MDVPQRLALVAARTQGLATTRMLADAGVASWRLSRAVSASQVVRVRPQLYATSPLPSWPRYAATDRGIDPAFVLLTRAELLSRGTRCWARGLTAAILFGWPVLVEPTRVELAIPHGDGRTARPGVSQHRHIDPCSVRALPGTDPLRCLSPVTTALDACRRLPFTQAVVVVDSALRAGHVDLEVLCLQARSRAAMPGGRRVPTVLAATDPRSGSVLETVARLKLVKAGLTGFQSQYRASDRAGAMWVDFCWPHLRLVLEVDGARWHPDPTHDRGRDNRLAALGFRVLRLTWAQVVLSDDWLRLVASAVAAGGTP